MSLSRMLQEIDELMQESEDHDRPTLDAMSRARWYLASVAERRHGTDLLADGTASGMEGWITLYWLNKPRHLHVTFPRNQDDPVRLFWREGDQYGGCAIDVEALVAWLVWYHGGIIAIQEKPC